MPGRNTGVKIEANAWSYPLAMEAGHLITAAQGKRYLIDTGSPVSLGSQPIRLTGREYPVLAEVGPGMAVAALAEMAGLSFDGLIGMDILGGFDVALSVRESRVMLSEASIDLSAGEAADFASSLPVVNCRTGGQGLCMVLDTGAPLSYLTEEQLVGWPEDGEAEDFHPMLGRFRVRTRRVEVEWMGVSCAMSVGSVPESLERVLSAVGAAGILGTAILAQSDLMLSQRQKRVAVLHG